MNKRTFLNRLPGLRTFGLLSALAGISIFWACRINSADASDHFDLKADSVWATCDSLTVILEDTSGHLIDTLFNDTLKSLSQLSNLSADKYPGGKAQVRIVGRKNGGLCVEQTRGFDDHGGPVLIDTVALPSAAPASVEIKPASLDISVGDASVQVVASIKPAFADQAFAWSVEDASIATLEFPAGPESGKVLVVPQKNGVVKILAHAKKDPTKTAELLVHVGSVSGKTVSITPDTLKLYLGGADSLLVANVSPDSTGVDVAWSSADEKIAKVNDKGVVSPQGEGSTTVRAKFGDAAATAVVNVKRDVPILTVASKTGAGVNVPIVFSPKATQEYGSIVMFKWDLAGDGDWDDSLPGPFLGANVDLPAQTAKYSKPGPATAKFLVRDSEGNEAIVSVNLDIGNQPPEVLRISNDTVVSIKDSVPLIAKVHDLEGKVVSVGWDFENDGKFDDTLKNDDSLAEFKSGHRYDKEGEYLAVFKAVDDNGKARLDTVKIKVLLDPPVADAGKDTTVIAGTPVKFTVGGKDSLGTLVKRELKVGAGPFVTLSKKDTSITLPGDSGKVTCVARVTDDDGNSDEDTMVVTIVAPDKSNNQLGGLVPSAGLLSPAFKPVTIIYSLAVSYADSQVTLAASTFDPNATLAINGLPVNSGSPSDPVAVKVGTSVDVFKIVVTAQDGNQRVYSVSVTRASSTDASLSKLETFGFVLKPAFASATLDYADTVANSVASVTLKPTSAHPAAKITVNDSAVVSGASSKPQDLVVGDNLIKVSVTAQDGKTKATYNLKVVRRAKLILTRIAGGGDPQRTDSLEYPLGTTVSIKSPDTLGFHFQKWVVTPGTGTLADSSANPTDLTLKSPVVRVLGVFVFNVYKISTSIDGFAGGVFSPEVANVQHGKDTTITVTPLVGYRILSLTDNGTEVSTLGTADKLGPRTYKLVNVTVKHDLVAKFLKTYTLTASVTGTGTITPPGAIVVDSGTTKEYALASGSPSTGIIVSSLKDNDVEQVGAVTGDPMNSSKYTLAAISANHTIAVTFSVKIFAMKVNGHKLCVTQVSTCVPTPDHFCPVNFCLFGAGPDTETVNAPYGTTWNISTSDTIGTRKFLSWSKDGASFSTAAGIVSSPVTANVTYQANYEKVIINCCIIGTCCVIGGPIGGPVISDPVLSQPLQSSPAASQAALPMSTEPLPPEN